jgi:hypothetical protein
MMRLYHGDPTGQAFTNSALEFERFSDHKLGITQFRQFSSFRI